MNTITAAMLLFAALLAGCVHSPREARAAGSNAHFRHEMTTRAPRAAIWALWIDPASWPRWDQELRSASLDGPPARHVTGQLHAKGSPASSFKITAFTPGESYTLEIKLPLGHMVLRRYFVDDPACTRFVHEVELRGVGGRALAPFLGPRYRAALPVVMEALRDLAESSAVEAP